MIILGLETASLSGGVALLGPEGLIGSVDCTGRALQSQRLMPSIDWLLARTAMKLSDVGAVAISSGPGSYTGLRIGAAVAKSLSWGLNIPLIAVPTLEALARRGAVDAEPGTVIVPMLDARQGQVFAALFMRQVDSAVPERLTSDMALPLDELWQWLPPRNPVMLLGDASVKYAELARSSSRLSGRLVDASPLRRTGSAQEVALLGREYLAAGRTTDLVTFEPDYLAKGAGSPW